MFGNLMGNMEEHQQKLQEKLSAIEVSEAVGGVKITANAAREMKEISIAPELMTTDGKEELEDLLLVAFNNITKKIQVEEGKASQDMINNILPGMSGLFG